MIFRSGKLNNFMLSVILFFVALNLTSGASTGKIDSSINNLYENLLQREYAGPISFPDHQVERKAQRSPSLRLRFGRSDPDMIPMMSAEKRWFGEVNQKPIRSPSLRLRFGRRSDPLMMANENAYFSDYNNDNDNLFDNSFNDDYPSSSSYLLSKYQDEKEKRKQPSFRLRFGRSLNPEFPEFLNSFENYLQSLGFNENFIRNNDDRLNSLAEAMYSYMQGDNSLSRYGYNRDIRKPAVLRLRWGRSTGGNEKEEQVKSLHSSMNNPQLDDVNQQQHSKQENKA